MGCFVDLHSRNTTLLRTWQRAPTPNEHTHLVSPLFLTNVVGEGPLEAVEDEPAFLPGLDLAPHLHQVALAHLLGEDDVVAGVHAVARRLHVRAQVELLLPNGQVAGHRTRLVGEGGGGNIVRQKKKHVKCVKGWGQQGFRYWRYHFS